MLRHALHHRLAIATIAVVLILLLLLLLATKILPRARKEPFTVTAATQHTTSWYGKTLEYVAASTQGPGADIGMCMRVDGRLTKCATTEREMHEVMVHFAASYVPRPLRKVLIIGGGDGGVLREVLKYESLRQATLLEPDIQGAMMGAIDRAEVIDWSDGAFKDPRVRVLLGDIESNANALMLDKDDVADDDEGGSRRPLFLPSTAGDAFGQLQSYDMVAVDMHGAGLDVSGGSAGRSRVYKELRLLMRDDGVMVVEGVEDRPILQKLFPHTLMYGVGEFKFIVCSPHDLRATPDSDMVAWRRSGVETKVYDPSRHAEYVPLSERLA